MTDRFQCDIRHWCVFVKFNKLGYKGLEEVLEVDPDFWGYFEILIGLKDLGYPCMESLWYYDAMDINQLVLLKDDAGINRMKIITLITRNVNLYVKHPVYREKSILSLENNVGSNGKEEESELRDKDSLEDFNTLKNNKLDYLNNGVIGIFDDLGTFEYLNNLSDKFDKGETTDIEDTYAVDQESSYEELICNQEEDEGLECNKKDGGGSEDDSALNVNLEDSDKDVIGIGEEIAVENEDGKGKGKRKGEGKGKVKGKAEGKGKGKGKGKGNGKAKVGRPRKQMEVEESVEGSGSIDDMNEGVVLKENFRGMSDIEEYDSDYQCHKDGHNKATCKLPTTLIKPTPTATSTQTTPPATSTQPTPDATSAQPITHATSTQPTPDATTTQLTLYAASTHPTPIVMICFYDVY
ncbi:hypothetical protein KIW84_014665 [Lathyrus oleraceus]|uniref:PB1-like domain-containing protein n=1 Tax=Pisum sativum TaxID=3888 RepID=A0A9D5BNA1_PEA|nr:hypothetical protein KIW84_014665 [Pisum sativum]